MEVSHVIIAAVFFFTGIAIGTFGERKYASWIYKRYNCFNACKFRNDPHFVLPIKFDELFEIKPTKPIETTYPKNMTYEEFKKGFEL